MYLVYRVEDPIAKIKEETGVTVNKEAVVIITTLDYKGWFEDFGYKNVYYIEKENNNNFKKCLKLIKEKHALNKFDNSIINPPYKGKLYSRILTEVIKNSNNIVYLGPSEFITDWKYKEDKHSTVQSDICNKIEEFIPISKSDMMKNFEGTTFNKDCCVLKINMLSNNGKSPKDFINPVIYKLLDKLKNFETLNDHKDTFNGEFVVKVPFIHGHQGGKDFIETVSPKCTVNGNTSGYAFGFSSYEEGINFINQFKLNVYKFIVYMHKRAINNDFSSLIWLGNVINPTTNKLGYTSSWTDKDLCKLFDITDDEYNYIVDTVSWYN